jgi:hypothetical protein
VSRNVGLRFSFGMAADGGGWWRAR